MMTATASAVAQMITSHTSCMDDRFMRKGLGFGSAAGGNWYRLTPFWRRMRPRSPRGGGVDAATRVRADDIASRGCTS
jgi:hypothetical protein